MVFLLITFDFSNVLWNDLWQNQNFTYAIPLPFCLN